VDKIIIKDLTARGIIGINDWEREKKQEILINIVLETDIRQAGLKDAIDDSVDYRAVAKKVIAHAESAACYTVEALVTGIARICLDEPRVQKVKVRVEKPGAVRFSRSVGVEIERSRGEL
jgi:FolB domain-containing protein